MWVHTFGSVLFPVRRLHTLWQCWIWQPANLQIRVIVFCFTLWVEHIKSRRYEGDRQKSVPPFLPLLALIRARWLSCLSSSTPFQHLFSSHYAVSTSSCFRWHSRKHPTDSLKSTKHRKFLCPSQTIGSLSSIRSSLLLSRSSYPRSETPRLQHTPQLSTSYGRSARPFNFLSSRHNGLALTAEMHVRAGR